MNEQFMELALSEARLAQTYDEVPVGAVIVKDGKVIAKASNRKERENCAVFHAEIVAIIEATKALSNWYLDGCEMYVTLEPCPMCAGAIINSRIDKLYFGAYDYKSGCCGSIYNLVDEEKFNHRLEVVGGVMENECSEILTSYFKNKRLEKKAQKKLMQNKNDKII